MVIVFEVFFTSNGNCVCITRVNVFKISLEGEEHTRDETALAPNKRVKQSVTPSGFYFWTYLVALAGD